MAFGPTAGFALVETLAALGLLSLGAVGLVSGFAAGLRAQEGALLQRTALQAMADVGELLRASPVARRAEQAQGWSDALLASPASTGDGSWRPRSFLVANALSDGSGWEAEVAWRDRLGSDERRLRVPLALSP